MDFAFDLLQGLGIAAAVGIRPFLPVLLVGALARADAGIDFGGTDFSFLEEAPFLLAVIVLVALNDVLRRRVGEDRMEAGTAFYGFAALAIVVGALEAGGSLADRDHPVVPGLVGGAGAAALGFMALRSLFARVRARLDVHAAGYLPLYREAIALVVAGLSVLFPPLALIALAALAWLLSGGRRREGEKYAGLRILR